MIRTFRRALATAAICLLPALAAAEDTQWLHVAVDDGDERVRVNVPLTVVSAALPLIEAENMRHGRVRIDDVDMDPEDLVAFLRAVRDADDGEYVSVEDRGETVKVSKEGEYLWVKVQDEWDEDETVTVKMPIDVLSALVSGEDDELNIMAALEALSKYENEDLVTVADDGSTVRIWVDTANAQSD